MKLKNFLLIFSFVLFYSVSIYSQIEVVIRADKDYVDYMYSMEKVNLLNYKTVSESCYAVPSLNLIHKGFPYTQAHLFINGGSFEQVGIFIDDIKFNDTQTGHYNFDFAFTSLDIENINIIKRGTSIYGSGALNGMLNIKIKDIEKDSFEFVTDYGTYNTFYSAMRASKKFEEGGLSISFEKSFSDGYHYDTDYTKETVFVTGTYLKNEIYLGYDEKEYGAYDYYTPGKNQPSREFIITRFGRINTELIENFELSAYIRTHSDIFTLNKDVTPLYQNSHLNILYGGLIKYAYHLNHDNTINFKYNWQREEIQSSRLGYHHRIKNSGLVNTFFSLFENIKTNLNLAVENYDVYKTYDFLPSVNIIYKINENLNVMPYYSYSARYPNWTELYYQDPFNRGDSSLKPERSHETGVVFNFVFDNFKINVGGLYRAGFDLIDWYKNSPSDSIWQIKNIGKIITTGFNAGSTLNLFSNILLKIDYSYLDSYFSEKYISKYGLSYLRNKISAGLEFNLFDVISSIEYVHKAYIGREDTVNNIDVSFNRKINEWLIASCSIKNALNYYFEEIKGIPAPGRSINGKIQIKF